MPGSGPQLVITDKALFDFATETHEMRLISLHPGVTLEQVDAEIGWQVKRAETIVETPPPTSEELRYIHVDLDPSGMYSKNRGG